MCRDFNLFLVQSNGVDEIVWTKSRTNGIDSTEVKKMNESDSRENEYSIFKAQRSVIYRNTFPKYHYQEQYF